MTTPGGPFKATIAWTDVPGTPLVNPALNNRTPSLVNDLDLRIVNVATNQVLTDSPWKLDPDNPSAAATRGDNVVDNVEQVYIANLPAGTYKLRVTHKGTLQTPPMYMIPGARQGSTSQDFSLFATGITSSALPVRLISFQGTPRQVDALLQWRIADAVNFSHFDVERSTDGKRFEMIQKVSYSAELSNYEFADMNAIRSAGSDNAVYYRLKLTDLDGSFAFSRIVAVRFDKTLDPVAAGRAYPNPFTDQFLVTIPADATLVKLLDIQGRVVRQFVPQTAQTELKINSLANLPAGIYLLSVQTPTRVVTQRLLKR